MRVGLNVLVFSMLIGSHAMADEVPGHAADAYIEFLWERTPPGAIARQETRAFALGAPVEHQVCVAVMSPGLTVHGMTLTAVDASGARVSGRTYGDFDGEKKCYPADLPAASAPGTWTYTVRLNEEDSIAGERTVEVFASVEALIASTPPGMPYVLGRPNYGASIPPEDFRGELSWAMHIDRAGIVRRVDIVRAEGVGLKMRDRAIAAGLLSLFPPDPDRSENATFLRTMSFRPDN